MIIRAKQVRKVLICTSFLLIFTGDYSQLQCSAYEEDIEKVHAIIMAELKEIEHLEQERTSFSKRVEQMNQKLEETSEENEVEFLSQAAELEEHFISETKKSMKSDSIKKINFCNIQ